MVQDLKAVNDAEVTVHPLMAKPYNTLTQISEDAKSFTQSQGCLLLPPSSFLITISVCF